MKKEKKAQYAFYIIYFLYTLFVLYKIFEVAKNNYEITSNYIYSFYWLNPVFAFIITPTLLLKYIGYIICVNCVLYLKYTTFTYISKVIKIGFYVYILTSLTTLISELLIVKKSDIVINIFSIIRHCFNSMSSFIIYFIFISLLVLFVKNLTGKIYLSSFIAVLIQLISFKIAYVNKIYYLNMFLPTIISREIIITPFDPHNPLNWAYNNFAFPYANSTLIIDIKKRIIGLELHWVIVIICLYICLFVITNFIIDKKERKACNLKEF